MSFEERYRLLELAGDEGAKAFVAQENSTGKKVTVFLFVGEQARAQADFIVQLRTVDRARFPELIETGDNHGTPYVVTEPLDSLSELKNRLSHLEAAPQETLVHKPGEFSKAGVWHIPATFKSAPEGAAKVFKEPPATDSHQTAQTSAHSAPGSFTQMFQAPAAPIGEPLPEMPKAPTPPAAPPPAQPAPGSFTQMFQAPATPFGEPVPEMPKTPTPPAAPPPAQPAPGSFTQMFQAPAAPFGEPVPEMPKAPMQPAAPPPAQPAPGAFTQMFQAPAAPFGEPVPEMPKAPMQPVQPKPMQSGPGEFTRFFSAASSSSPAPTPMPQKPESQGEFARIFGSGGSGDRVTTPPATVTGIFSASSSAASPQQSETAPTPPRAYKSPGGEFTKLFGDTGIGIPMTGPMAPMPTPGTTPPPSGSPGEYTRMFSAQPLPQEPLAEPVPAPIGTQEASAPAKRPSKMIPVLIGAILLLLAAIAVIVIAMRK